MAVASMPNVTVFDHGSVTRVLTTETHLNYPDLQRMGQRAPLRVYLADLWRRRDFAIVIPTSSFRAQNMDTVLGNVWHLLNPMLQIGVYFLIFGVLLNTDRGVANTFGFISIGVFAFRFTSRAAQRGATSVVNNRGLLNSVQFPRAILPIASVVQQLLAFGSALIVVFGVLFATGESPRLTWLLMIPVVVTQLLFALGITFFTARLTAEFRDFPNVLQYVFRLFFYGSGVLFPVTRFVKEPWHQLYLFDLNPIYDFLELWRGALLAEFSFSPRLWLIAAAWTVVTLISGFLFFKAGENRYGRE